MRITSGEGIIYRNSKKVRKKNDRAVKRQGTAGEQ